MTSPLLASERVEAEAVRLQRQEALDAERTALERNKAGQFATPPALADQIVRYAVSLASDELVFLEPSCGSGAFYSALLATGNQVHEALGVELDPRFASLARQLWEESGLRVVEGDFLDTGKRPTAFASLVVANPPYVRHHHLDAETKRKAKMMVEDEVGIKVSGLAGLYVYFLLLTHRALKPGAISAWLIPSEFMDVNYGRAVKEYLTKHVRLRRIHRFDPADLQFDDALVTSAVVVFENAPPSPGVEADFTHGGSLDHPRDGRSVEVRSLDPAAKWGAYYKQGDSAGPAARIDDLFTIRRGIATGSNRFFVLPRAEVERLGIKRENLTPILPSPRGVCLDVLRADEGGYPVGVEQLALVGSDQPWSELVESDPALAQYLDGAPEKVREGYLVRNRSPWYRQEKRQPAPFLLTYMGRGTDADKPFRFILNYSSAVTTNMYLMLYPKPCLQRYLESDPKGLVRVHRELLALSGEDLRTSGRVYGGGLHKMEPRELAAMDASGIVALSPELLDPRLGQLPLGL